MKNFITSMLSDSGQISSKRVIAFQFSLLIIAMIVGSQFFNKPLDFSVLVVMITTVLTLVGINAALQAKSMSVKKDVASDIVTNTGQTDDAKDVLQSDKP